MGFEISARGIVRSWWRVEIGELECVVSCSFPFSFMIDYDTNNYMGYFPDFSPSWLNLLPMRVARANSFLMRCPASKCLADMQILHFAIKS
jgi:hypothetical protein